MAKKTETYAMLNEASNVMSTDYKIDLIRNPRDVFMNDEAYNRYISVLGEGLSVDDLDSFETMADSQRQAILENLTPATNPYETLSLPLLRSFWPKMAVKRMLTVVTMDKPVIVKYFIKHEAVKNDGTRFPLPNPHVSETGGALNDQKFGADAASQSIDISAANIPVPGVTDLLGGAGLTSDVTFIAQGRTVITSITYIPVGGGSTIVNVNIPITVDGLFAYTQDVGASTFDTLQGKINHRAGTIELSSTRCDLADGKIVDISVQAIASMEFNNLNTKIELRTEKFILDVNTRKLSAEYSLEFEQDMRALFNIEAQAEIIDIMGSQIAVDYEQELIQDIIANVDAYNVANAGLHKRTFSKTVPGTFNLGTKEWYRNSLIDLETLSAQIHIDTNIAAANYVLVNPLDGVVLDGLRPEADGSVSSGAYNWNILQSTLVPKGRMILGLNPDNERATCYYWGVYRPAEAVLGYPSADIPSMTVLGRYTKRMVRPAAFAELEITA